MADRTLGPYVQGERPAPLVVTFTEEDRVTALDLTDYDARAVIAAPGVDPVTRDASVTAPETGEVTYVWDDEDLLLGTGTFELEVWVGNGTNRFASERFIFYVREPLAVPEI